MPAVAYGRVYAPNTDGYVYSFGETTGKLRWARKAGTYVYSAPAIYKKTVYVGTYHGYLVAHGRGHRQREVEALHARRRARRGHRWSTAIVYFSTLSRASTRGSARYVKDGPGRTFGLNAGNGKLVWGRDEGRYILIIADGQRVYFTGLGHLDGLEPRQ